MMTLTIVPMPDAPRPWTARPAIKASIRGAKAQIRLPPRKIVNAISMIGFRPQMSATVPQTGAMAVLARMKAVPIQTYPDTELKELTMVGIAGVNIVRSSDESVTERQSGVMVKAMAAPDSFWTSAWGSADETGWTVLELLV